MNPIPKHSSQPWPAPFSYLAWSAVARLGVAALVSALLWAAVAWSLS